MYLGQRAATTNDLMNLHKHYINSRNTVDIHGSIQQETLMIDMLETTSSINDTGKKDLWRLRNAMTRNAGLTRVLLQLSLYLSSGPGYYDVLVVTKYRSPNEFQWLLPS